MRWRRAMGVLGVGAVLTGAAFAQASATMLAVPLPAAQTLAPGDLVQVSVFQAPELATTARLDAAGAITMPEAGHVVLAGLSAVQAETALEARLQAHYLRAPQVQLLVREFAPQPVTVLGAVRDPGVYSARSYPTLAAVLAAAGGVTTPAGGEVFITASGSSPNAAPVQVDLTLMERTAAAPAIAVAGGDVVRVVPEATVYIGGDVAKPGAYALPSTGLTLVEALSLAGGIARDGRAAQTRLVHTSAGGHLSTEWIDARPILAGKAPDRALQPFDLVYVPYSPQRAAVFHGLETAVNVGTTILTGLIVFH
ncbi:MAG TPA: polysaccharide biosynthesis/export family protein [Terriglobales bacterium]|nr:polysaccharide biosynthesis/export family protein [Terriglobales bacterium]